MTDPSGLTAEPLDPAERGVVARTLARIATSWDAFGASLRGLPDGRLLEPGVSGTWSAKDILAHVAYWDRRCVEDVHRRAAGEPERARDWRAENDAEAARFAALTLEEARRESGESHGRVLAVLRALPPLDPERHAVCAFVEADTCAHYDEHAAEIRAWRERAGV